MNTSNGAFIKSSGKLYKALSYLILILLAVVILVPVMWAFMASIKQNVEFYGSPWALPEGFYVQNFADAWLKANMGNFMLNSILLTAMSIVLLLIIALPAAYVLARYQFRGNALWSTMFMAGLFININYIVVPIFLMLNNGDKLARNVLGQPIFLNNLFILALVYTAMALPFTIYLLSGYFKTLSKEYEEAASVDGAGHFRTMVQVIMPMAKPSIITIILFNFLSFWNEYIISMTLLTKPEFKTLPVGLMNLLAAQKSAVEYGQLYAGLVIVMLPTLLLYILVQKKLTQGMTMGGLKG
ncbi:carbohydrate ABC transporter permease [Paenibacillus camelliae]|uniref:carbohydrate ABC transporter permease n=1 Tax=Paenibacillus camelliae TaxID=512410 RepID=UPI00203B5BBE|nr:carbohydrate ABC transporter permease [Paenibacillus camelliae]MCM3634299.1 carbohydrate ABC transporter permease [Paenibacillus camelliae]